MHWASYLGHDVMIRTLLKYGANINAKDNQGYTALHWAANKGNSKVLTDLGARGEVMFMFERGHFGEWVERIFFEGGKGLVSRNSTERGPSKRGRSKERGCFERGEGEFRESIDAISRKIDGLLDTDKENQWRSSCSSCDCLRLHELLLRQGVTFN